MDTVHSRNIFELPEQSNEEDNDDNYKEYLFVNLVYRMLSAFYFAIKMWISTAFFLLHSSTVVTKI
ncbi:MAG: hypothetical protein ACI8RD_011352 [Bacillariaceae sp.]|jgi:hypothetical protein